MQVQKLTQMRLQKEEASLDREPLANALVARDGMLNFHFCLYNLEGPYEGGFYHGLLELHENYPFMAPKLIFYTPNGRFDTNIPICTSFTNYHQETWTSAWNVRTLILATVSFMYSEEPSYGCRTEPDSVRKDYAANSIRNNMNSEIFARLFGQKLREMGKLPEIKEEKEQPKEEGSEKKRKGSMDGRDLVVSNEAVEENS
jgi:ubiquitin-conjugating enzyme E2 J2